MSPPSRGITPSKKPGAVQPFTTGTLRALTVRDRHCRWPGCTIPAAWTQAHHIIHWADNGPSDLDNAILLCGQHHDLLHHHHHQVIINSDGTRTIDTHHGSDAHCHGGPLKDNRAKEKAPPDP